MAKRISRAITTSQTIVEKTSEPARIQPNLTSDPKKKTSAVEIPRTHTRHDATRRIKALEGWNEEINVFEISSDPVFAKFRNTTRSCGNLFYSKIQTMNRRKSKMAHLSFRNASALLGSVLAKAFTLVACSGVSLSFAYFVPSNWRF